MIKFVVAALWICIATLGAVFYSFQSAGAKPAPEAPKPMLGGLDYIKTDILSVPVLRNGRITGYFLARLVYTADPKELARLTVPAEALLVDQTYSYVFGNPELDFAAHEKIDVDAFRKGLLENVNARIGEKLLHDVLIEQMDYLSKEEIRDNAIRRRKEAGATARAMAKGFEGEAGTAAGGHGGGHEAPAPKAH